MCNYGTFKFFTTIFNVECWPWTVKVNIHLPRLCVLQWLQAEDKLYRLSTPSYLFLHTAPSEQDLNSLICAKHSSRLLHEGGSIKTPINDLKLFNGGVKSCMFYLDIYVFDALWLIRGLIVKPFLTFRAMSRRASWCQWHLMTQAW